MGETDYVYREGSSGASKFDVLKFFFRRQLAKVRTTTIVKVLSVTNDGGVTAVGFVDVQPLVQQVDSQGNAVDLPPIYKVPYLRIQGGTNAVILDPQVGDLGIAVFGDRDLSAVKSAKQKSPPGSGRRHSLADALYLGGILNGAPTQYVQFNSDGITVLSPTAVLIKAPNVKIDGKLEVTGEQTNDSSITASGEVEGKGIKLSTHTHTGVQSGSNNSGPPTS